MPAVLTHDFFGRDVIDTYGRIEEATLDERDAFLLGSQGPDPLFFLAINPTFRNMRKLGSTMHREHPTELLYALHQSLGILSDGERDIGDSYAQGFLCHYALDSIVHPLIYATQFALCDAGIEGLSRQSGHEVHSEIERELDEMVLFTKRGQTIRAYPPAENVLEGSPMVLAVVQKMYAYVALTVYGRMLDEAVFPAAVRSYRAALQALYSPSGIKRNLVGMLERNVREHSLFAAMAHRAEEVHSSWYANPDHNVWIHPFTGEAHTESFWDLYENAQQRAAEYIGQFSEEYFTLEDARAITQEINFKGEYTVPTLTVEE